MEFILLIGLIILGFTLAKLGWLKERLVKWGNKYIIYIALPVVALAKIPSLEISNDLLVLVLIPIGILLFSFLVFQVLLRRLYSQDERLVFTLTSGLGNTSFVGFPLIIFYFGATSLSYGALFDQTTFLLMASVGQALIVRRPGVEGLLYSVRKVLTFPVFATIIICFFIPANIYPDLLIQVFDVIIYSLSVVAMIIIGYLIASYVSLKIPRKVLVALAYKLAVAPLLCLFALSFLQISEEISSVALLESSMAPQTSICLMLLDHNKLPQLVSQILCWGTVLSLMTSGLWMLIA